ncbi:MAG: GTP-binding protein [Candidatus Methanomethylicaceae archaeon]
MKYLAKEEEEGNIEYKLKVACSTNNRLEELASQIRYRLAEKGGEAFYLLGVSDSGEPIGLSDEELRISLENINKAANLAGAKVSIIREAKGKKGKIVELLLRRSRDQLPIQISVITVGQADHGKTTTVGVLVTGESDNGDGLIMGKIARYKHEVLMRRTSSVVERIMGFDEEGNVVNYVLPSPLDEAQVYLNSSKLISFIDIGGHERYLKTAVRGLLSHNPDYAMLVIAGNVGISTMTKEHLGIALSFKIPIFVVITKKDIAPEQILSKTIEELIFLLKSPGVNKIPILIKDLDDVAISAKNMNSGGIAPIFIISNKTKEGLDLLKNFLNLLPPRLKWDGEITKPFLVYIDDKFNVPGVGVVVSGLILQGWIKVGEKVWIGPFGDGSFKETRIKSMHAKKGVYIDKAQAGNSVTFAITDVSYDEVEKGMVLIGEKMPLKASRIFEGEVFILHHPTTIRPGYEAVFHIHSIRETCKLLWSSKIPLRTGDRAKIKVETRFHPIYVREGDRFLFREGRSRGIGVITRVIPMSIN